MTRWPRTCDVIEPFFHTNACACCAGCKDICSGGVEVEELNAGCKVDGPPGCIAASKEVYGRPQDLPDALPCLVDVGRGLDRGVGHKETDATAALYRRLVLVQRWYVACSRKYTKCAEALLLGQFAVSPGPIGLDIDAQGDVGDGVGTRH